MTSSNGRHEGGGSVFDSPAFRQMETRFLSDPELRDIYLATFRGAFHDLGYHAPGDEAHEAHPLTHAEESKILRLFLHRFRDVMGGYSDHIGMIDGMPG